MLFLLMLPMLGNQGWGQASGELSRSLSPQWMVTVLGAVIVATVREIAADRLDQTRAAEIVTATLLHGYRHA